MRVMVKATLDTEKGNEAILGGKMPQIIQGAMEKLRPEAAYFGPAGGRRTCFMVFDMQDSSQLPPMLEPFFNDLNAEIEVFPVMNGDDLQKGLSQMR
ncbi:MULTISPECIES: DUF3303 domain-containing protein [Streptomyces]|uniref:Muconolactone isomerase domain-containing protein n=1 Tax=Streptomyces chartreusis NRRL 3882 TaxID=1079985 RepID=A0A2N9BA48_STRCX|nr:MULTISPECIES: DUF3303 family protein [Streptomyces]MYS91125.1 hypothetical protein [Streptomyces sp. SID5464]SOR80215.1 hypothetical protein SCNRRL3882_3671 [Streptomyces chartreusis NRRL 3882]